MPVSPKGAAGGKVRVAPKRLAGRRSTSRDFTCLRRVRLRQRSVKVHAATIGSKPTTPEHVCSVLDNRMRHSARLDNAGFHELALSPCRPLI